MNKSITVLIVIGFLVTFMAINILSARATTLEQTFTSTATPILTPTNSITQLDLLSVYEEVLENTQSSIDNVRATTTTVLWLVGAAFTLLTVEGFGSLWLTQKTSREVSKSAQSIESTKKQALDVSQSLIRINGEVSKVNGICAELNSRTEKISSDLIKLDGLEEDINWYKKLMSLYDMRSQILRLDQANEWRDATNSLSFQLLQADPVVQVEVIHTLQKWITIEPQVSVELATRIVQILRSLLDSEPERLIQVEITHTIQMLDKRVKKLGR